MNQKIRPDDFEANGGWWEDLGVFEVTGSTIVARLSNAAEAGQYVMADAVRIERMGDTTQKTTVYVEGEAFQSSTYQPHFSWYSNSGLINWTLLSPGVAGVKAAGSPPTSRASPRRRWLSGT